MDAMVGVGDDMVCIFVFCCLCVLFGAVVAICDVILVTLSQVFQCKNCVHFAGEANSLSPLKSAICDHSNT